MSEVMSEVLSDVLINKDGLTEEEFLACYEEGNYKSPSNTVDMLIFTVDDRQVEDIRKNEEKELKILLIRRKDHPDIQKWALPGGFVDISESISDAAYRELAEETNIDNVYMEQLYTFGDNVYRDKRKRVISIAYMALVPKYSVKPIAGDDADDVAWFRVRKELIEENEDIETYRLVLNNDEKDINIEYLVTNTYVKNGIIKTQTTSIELSENSQNALAFDHYDIINLAIDRLRNKVEYTPIAFNLVPEKFTLNELQQVYEIILGRKLVKQNFRKWINKYVVSTNEMQENVGHRPAELFKYKPSNHNDEL